MEFAKETVHLVIRDGNQGVYVDKVEGPQTIRMSSRVGSRVPLHCTSVGKVLLADLTEDKIIELVGTNNLESYTENTITDLDHLLDELKEVAKKGYAIDNCEHEKDVRCVAAPIKNYNRNVVAAISVSTPAFRFSLDDIAQMSDKVKEIAFKISRQLGCIN